MGSGTSTQKLWNFQEFVLKVTLQSCKKVTFKKLGEQDVLLASPIILFGEQQPPVTAPMFIKLSAYVNTVPQLTITG